MYTSLAANEFFVLLMTENHFGPGAYTEGPVSQILWSRRTLPVSMVASMREYDEIGYPTDSHDAQLFKSMLEEGNTNAQSYEDLTPSQCTDLYNMDFVSGRRNLFLISNFTSDPTSIHRGTFIDSWTVHRKVVLPNRWMCPKILHSPTKCNPSEVPPRVASGLPWLIKMTPWQELEITGCQSEKVEERCKVQFSLGIMIAVICCNLVKAGGMIMTVVRSREPTLVTLGDAIDSFLSIPDPTTVGICFADRRFIEREWMRGSRAGPRPWKRKGVQRWWASVSKRRWIVCSFFSLMVIIIAGVLLLLAMSQDREFLSTDIKSL